jgi:hypothetical protein
MVRNCTAVGNHIGAEEPGREGAKIYGREAIRGRREKGNKGNSKEARKKVRQKQSWHREKGDGRATKGRRKQEN